MGERSGWEAFFDGHAPIYEENGFTRNTLAEVDFLVEALALAPGARVLDVGCGTGRHAIELARRGFRVTGIDLSAGMLAEARRKAEAVGVEVDFRQADATRFTVDAPHDAAICLCEGAFGLLGRGDDPIEQPLAILRRIAAALAPGAPCLFTVLNGYAMARRHGDADVAAGSFDPLGLAERSDVSPGGIPPGTPGGAELRERGFVPTELVLLFRTAGLAVEAIWGGTAGDWGRRPVALDEMEIMVLARAGAGGEAALPKLYSDRADWFHLLTAPEEYREEAAFYRSLLESRSLTPPRTLLELGSGGGNNASHLKAYFDLTLVDLSPRMLAVSEVLNPECEHLAGDMRTVRLGRRFDAVFVQDAIAHLATEEDLARAIATAFVHCRPGGVALFAPDFVRETFRPGADHGGHDGGGRGLRYLEWFWDPDPGDTTYRTELVYLMRHEDGRVESEHDRFELGLFARADWLRLLAAAGFAPEAIPVPDTGEGPGAELFLCRRPG
ncbi:MAG: methyltransferase domain-containing protein [Thermoanaerobaculia bacterium]|nr:methyltransferase domain-containing protein [Thermoanaerobaculia bacterium]